MYLTRSSYFIFSFSSDYLTRYTYNTAFLIDAFISFRL
jgi:hypothetical protein